MLKRQSSPDVVISNFIIPQALPVRKFTATQLKRAARIKKEIDALQEELARILGGGCK